MRYSDDLADCWKRFALELELPSERIKAINTGYVEVTDKCFYMFDAWLERSRHPCWCEIVEAFKMVNMVQIAEKIAKSYLCKC